MLPTIKFLIESLNDASIQYCHWKSNWALPETLMGETDLDLLIHRSDARRFREALKRLGFNPAIEAGAYPIPSVEHHVALDGSTGSLAHVHAYYRLISGESLAKNYRLPLEVMLLTNLRREGIVNVPVKGAELIIFTLRMLLKHTTLIGLVLLTRDWPQLRREVAWLMTDDTQDEAVRLLSVWLPHFDVCLFRHAFDALRRPAPLWRRIVLGHRVRRRLRSYARHGWLRARTAEAAKFTGMAMHRLAGSKKKLTPAGGGAVIAFVGSEATGKSTMLEAIANWLAKYYTVRRIHTGKPPGTLLTFIPHYCLPLLRALLPKQRSTRVEAQYAAIDGNTDRRYPLLFGLRAVMLAYERRALLRRAFAWSANGTIVLSDRYPSSRSGAPDSPQLGQLPTRSGPVSLRHRLASLEAGIYRDIPAPDLVFHFTAPLSVTLARNAARAKTEPEDYVRFRHSLSSNLDFDGVSVYHIDTDREIEVIGREVKQAIWDAL